MSKKIGLIGISICMLSIIGNIGAVIYFFSIKTLTQPINGSDPSLNRLLNDPQEFPFLSKRIFAEQSNDIFISFMPLRLSLRDYVGKQEQKISIYFEYLPSGSSIGINDTEEVQMASLLKLPTVMAVYKKIEEGELTKGQVLTAIQKDLDPLYGNFWKQGVGASLTVEEAIRKTLIESDNTTQKMLYRTLSPEDEHRLHNELDARMETVGTKTIPYISAKSYSSFLRSLYLASYLNRNSSNEILSILTESTFDDGVEAGVDAQIKVAHKTGNIDVDGKERVTNDCGIIYIPQRPYILCIFVKGGTEKQAQESMQYLSGMIYGYVTKINSK